MNRLKTIMVFRNQVFGCFDGAGEEMNELKTAVQAVITDYASKQGLSLTGVIVSRDDHWEMFHATGEWTRSLAIDGLIANQVLLT